MSEHDSPEVWVRASEDRLAILLDCTVSESDPAGLAARIGESLAELGVKREIPQQELAAWLLQQADASGRIAGKTLMEGKRPVPPKDGALEWAGDFFSDGFVVDERTGAVDYRRRKAQATVAAGQLLVRIVEPVEGEPGVDVFGGVIPVARPKRPRVKAGKNVRLDESEGILYADAAGRIRLSNDTLSVDDVFVVDGSVGLETGHIDHPGAVVIEQDILEGSEVKAAGDVEVHGVVEAASIEAGGNLTVHGGITGTEGTHIRVAGSVHARFLLEAAIEAGEDVVVDKEIVNSVVKSRGAVDVPAGRIVGGVIVALGGVSAAEIGSEGLSPTRICAGEDFELARKIEAKEEDARRLARSLEKIEGVLAPLLPKKYMLPEAKRQIVKQLESEVDKIKAVIAQSSEDIAAMRAESRARAHPQIQIRDEVWPETTIVIDGEYSKVRERLPGPLLAHIARGEVVIRPRLNE